MNKDKISLFLVSMLGLNLTYILLSPFIMMYLLVNLEESKVDSTMVVISIIFEIITILISLLLSYKLNYGGDE